MNGWILMTMKNNETVSIIQIILLMITAIGLKNHVIVIPPLLKEGGRDAWIAVIAMSLLLLVWGILLLYIYNTLKGKHIQTWLNDNIGKIGTNILLYIVSIYLLIMAATTLKETILWTSVSYLNQTPPFILTIIFILPCMLAAITNIQTITITNFFFLALVIVFGHFVAITNTQFKDYSLLLPVMENGYVPILKAMIYQGTGIIELITLLFLQHQFKSKLRYRHFIVLVVLLTWLTLGPLIGAIIEFGPKQAAMQRYPAYEEWGLARLGTYIEHVDYLSIYQWLSGAFIRITLILYLIRVLLNKKSKTVNVWITFISSILLGAIVMYPFDERIFFDVLLNFLLPFTFWFLLGLSFFLGLLAFMYRKKLGAEKNVQEK